MKSTTNVHSARFTQPTRRFQLRASPRGFLGNLGGCWGFGVFGQALITLRRFATVEPVFGNLRHNKPLNRFTLRGQRKVDAQWKLYCLAHNIEKLAHHGYAQ